MSRYPRSWTQRPRRASDYRGPSRRILGAPMEQEEEEEVSTLAPIKETTTKSSPEYFNMFMAGRSYTAFTTADSQRPAYYYDLLLREMPKEQAAKLRSALEDFVDGFTKCDIQEKITTAAQLVALRLGIPPSENPVFTPSSPPPLDTLARLRNVIRTNPQPYSPPHNIKEYTNTLYTFHKERVVYSYLFTKPLLLADQIYFDEVFAAVFDRPLVLNENLTDVIDAIYKTRIAILTYRATASISGEATGNLIRLYDAFITNAMNRTPTTPTTSLTNDISVALKDAEKLIRKREKDAAAAAAAAAAPPKKSKPVIVIDDDNDAVAVTVAAPQSQNAPRKAKTKCIAFIKGVMCAESDSESGSDSESDSEQASNALPQISLPASPRSASPLSSSSSSSDHEMDVVTPAPAASEKTRRKRSLVKGADHDDEAEAIVAIYEKRPRTNIKDAPIREHHTKQLALLKEAQRKEAEREKKRERRRKLEMEMMEEE